MKNQNQAPKGPKFGSLSGSSVPELDRMRSRRVPTSNLGGASKVADALLADAALGQAARLAARHRRQDRAKGGNIVTPEGSGGEENHAATRHGEPA